MESRRIEVKLSNSGMVQFISSPDEINKMSNAFVAAKLPHEKSLLSNNMSILRLTPQIYDSLCPGAKKPIATFQDGNSNPPTKQIIFTNESKAHEYVNTMLSMGVQIIGQLQHVTINNGVEFRNGLYIIRTDQVGQAKLNASYQYFQKLKPYAVLQFLENNFANLLETFNQDALLPYAKVLSESLNSMRGIMANEYFSNRTKIMNILDVYNDRTGKSNDSVLGSIIQTWREVVRDPQSNNFLIMFENFNLKEKMEEIILQSTQLKHLTSTNPFVPQPTVQPVIHQTQSFAQQPTMTFDTRQPNLLTQQPVIPYNTYELNPFVPQPMMPFDTYEPNPFIQQPVVPQVINQHSPHMVTPPMPAQANPFLNQTAQGFVNSPFGFYTHTPPPQQLGIHHPAPFQLHNATQEPYNYQNFRPSGY